METPPWTSDVKLTKALFEDFEKIKLEEEENNVLEICDYEKWEETQKLCQRERRVIALEITNRFSESCARVRPLFNRLANEFPSVCLRVFTGPFPLFMTLDKVGQYCWL